MSRSGARRGCLIGVAIFMVLLVAAGWFFWGLAKDVIAEEAKGVLQEHPAVVEHFGRLEEVEWDFAATIARSGDEEAMVFRLQGEKGEGEATLLLDENEKGAPVLKGGTLVVPGGEKVPLEPLEGE